MYDCHRPGTRLRPTQEDVGHSQIDFIGFVRCFHDNEVGETMIVVLKVATALLALFGLICLLDAARIIVRHFWRRMRNG